jgi:ABC-type branched-subunit amino acid transport system substrate-binding protein/tRNA A-37 threonylcarbamoyl transferase component Bud32
MIVLRCSRCEKEIEIREPLANQTVLCPHCGELLAKGSDGEELEVADQETRLPPGQGPSGDTDPEELSFLQPKQNPDELGRLSHYRVLKLLGKGGMAMVFMAEDTILQRLIALKVMKPELARADLAAQRFMREAQIMARLRNDHVVTIFEVGREGTSPFLAMELLHGETLDTWLKKNRPSFDRVLQMGLQIAHGVAAAHQSGLIHRDIKPANIWVEESTGRIKVLDFGLARQVRDSGVLTQTGAVVGTPAYMAPEQAEGENVDERSDLFSLGCVLYEMASGRQAFVGTSAVGVLKAVALSEPAPLRSLSQDIPPAFSDLVQQLMSKDPAARPASATAVVEALEAIAAGETPSMVKRFAAGQLAKRRRPRFLHPAWVGTALAIFGIFLVLGLYFRSKSPVDGSKEPRPARALFRGVTDSEVVVGMSAPFSGPSRELGREMEVGIRTCLDYVNDQGGIAGRTIRLVALDDGYDPARAEANMRELFEKHQVFAVVGNVGTPTAEKTVPYALEKQMVFFGAFTGAALLRRDPPDRFVFNYRASYEEETGAMVKYLIEVRKVKPEQIGVFAQKDGYGDAGFRGVAKVLRKYGRDPEQILRVGYERNTSNVDEAVEKVLKATDLRAVIMVPTYKPAALFIRKIKDAGRDLLFANVSFVGSNPLAEELMEAGPKYASGVMVTQVVPYPQSQATAVLKYREALAKYRPNEKPSFVSLEGYIVGLVFTEGLHRAGDNLTTDSLIDALEGIRNLDLGIGTPLNFGPSEHQASRKVWGTVLDDKGQYHVLELD